MFHTVKLSKSDPTPIYIQLASELAKLIQQDLLYEGMKLPTIRHLSKQLSINRDTVVSAYKLLEQQGLVESHIGKGTYIASHKKNTSPSASIPIASMPQNPHICCSHLNLSADFFPTTLCQELTTQIITEEGWEAFSDPLYRERKALKQSVAHYLETLGVKTHFAQVRLIKDMETFLLNLFKLSPKVGVCVETPRDLTLSCYLRSIGAKVYEVPLTHEGMDLEILEKHLHTGTISAIFITPYLQNPTGICYSQDHLNQLLELAKKYDCLIVEDGTYCDFLTNTHYTPLYNLPHDGRILYLYHFSKVYLPYMKYSFAALPVYLIRRFQDDIDCSFNERFLRYYLDSDSLTSLKNHIIHTCKARYNYLLDQLELLHPIIQYPHQSGGLSLWCKVDASLYPRLLEQLTKQEIIIAPGELFSNQSLDGYFRLSISNVSYDEIDELVTSLGQILLPQNLSIKH